MLLGLSLIFGLLPRLLKLLLGLLIWLRLLELHLMRPRLKLLRLLNLRLLDFCLLI